MEAISRYLTKHGLSQDAFARRVGVSQAMVSQWLRGERPVSAERAVAIEKRTKGEIKRADLRADLFE